MPDRRHGADERAGQAHRRRTGGAHCHGYGDSAEAIRLAALDEARALYGDAAPLRIEHVGTVQTTFSRTGRFFADVTVRCLQLPEGW
jgi:predicted amidohydrolase YtcJ